MSIDSENKLIRQSIPTGTVAFLFSDIEGSTAHWEARVAQMKAALRRHDELMRNVIGKHGGYVFKTVGDEFCAAFSSVVSALEAARDAQETLGAQDWSAVDGLRVRMAIHTGLSDERDGDYFGPAVNRVARILATAHGGQVITSGAAAELVHGHLPAHVSLRYLGSHRLRDLAQPERIYQLVAPGLQNDFPPLRSLETLSNNLPIQLTSFIGRRTEAREVEELLSRSRLVTLTGAGGIGKTRMALQVAANVMDGYVDGVWFVDLGEIAGPDLVPSAIASVLRVDDPGGSRPLMDSIILSLKDKNALIILDSSEHVIAAVANAAESILSRCQSVKVLATSREPLGVVGEQAYVMPPLEVPSRSQKIAADEAIKYTAVALFVERARAALQDFALTDDNAPIVSEIVRRLDGIALAIELAAPRIRALRIDQLAHRLDERFKLLTTGRRTGAQRQQTLRATIDWSYDLLTDAEKTLLRQLAIFRGGWTLDAADAICVAARFVDWDVLALLSALVDKSLVVAELKEEEQRYRLLESTREYARERLEEAGEAEAVASRHAQFYHGSADRLAAAYWETNRDVWFMKARRELENYRAAIDWGLTRGEAAAAGAAIVASLGALWLESLPREGRPLTETALRSLKDDAAPDIRGRLLLSAVYLDVVVGSGAERAAKAVAVLARTGDRVNYANAVWVLAVCLVRAGK
ncbi:MAG: adenylate/guanylate cyclase domain-containing protein, partial [Candidatus Eremiobacteraeota bacterium]|nr:adenylate/guanylate cyclase domain-containing protein [Candidatus Eremiobacteraeota bacterium]